LALEDAIDEARRAAVLISCMRPIGDQTAGNDEETFPEDRRQLAPGRKRDDQIAVTYRRATPRNDNAATRRACESLDGPLGLARVTHVNRNHLNLEHRCHSLNDTELSGVGRDAGIPKNRNSRYVWRDLFEQLQPFHAYAVFVKHEPSDVTARPRQALDIASADWIVHEWEHDWHGSCHL